MYLLVIVAFNILGDLSVLAINDFATKKECESIIPRLGGMLLRDKVGMVPTELKAACVTDHEFEKFSQAVSERSKQMEQDGAKAKNSRS
jgi:hypothetical protein